MLDELRSALAVVQSLVERLDVDALTGPEAQAFAEAFVALERAAAAGTTLTVGRLDRPGGWVSDGTHRDLPSWLASVTGTTVGSSRATTETARRVRTLPATADALRAGSLSTVQAALISAAATVAPTSEERLLALAPTSGVKGLRAECDRISYAALSAAEQQERAEHAHRNRSLRHSHAAPGEGRIVITGPLDRTAQIMASLEPFERALFEEYRQAKTPQHPDAIAFDALLRLTIATAGGPVGSPPKKDARRGSRPLGVVNLMVSLDAYLRGTVEPGEVCEIDGAGPVPVSAAHRHAMDGFLRVVVTDGTDVHRVAHLGRTIPAHLRTAIETRDRVCVIEGCEVDRHLQIDHNDPVAALGATSLANLARMCHHHHDQKTRRDLRRVGPLGQQHLVTKDEYERASQADPERGPPLELFA